MRLNITNHGSYRTDDLRKLISAALRAEGMWAPNGWCQVEVEDCKGNNCHGLATIGIPAFKLMLPTLRGPSDNRRKFFEKLPVYLVKQLAQVAVHEIGHTQGMRHDEMVDWWEFEVPWADGLKVRLAESAKPKKVTPLERAERRSAHVDKKVAEVERKLLLLSRRKKALGKTLRGWRRKQRYYEKRAASPKPR